MQKYFIIIDMLDNSYLFAVSMFVWTQRAQEALLFTSREEAESIIKTFEAGRLYTIVEIIK